MLDLGGVRYGWVWVLVVLLLFCRFWNVWRFDYFMCFYWFFWFLGGLFGIVFFLWCENFLVGGLLFVIDIDDCNRNSKGWLCMGLCEFLFFGGVFLVCFSVCESDWLLFEFFGYDDFWVVEVWFCKWLCGWLFLVIWFFGDLRWVCYMCRCLFYCDLLRVFFVNCWRLLYWCWFYWFLFRVMFV